MKIKQSVLLTLSGLAFSQIAFGQAPVISYSPATYALSTGAPISISPANSDDAVPATV